jgi:soluble lytic murein transglycosylase
MPNTIEAQVALAAAYQADGQTERAKRIARSLWVDNFLDEPTEKMVLARLGDLLDRNAHWARAVRLMMHDRASAVERIMGRLTPAQKSLAVARNAVSRNAKDAKKLLDSVDPSMTAHPVFLFSRAQRARQFELFDDAISWLGKAKGEPPEAAEWWYERRLLTRQLLARGDAGRAYKAAAGYTQGPDGRLVEAQFHAGWIALSFLKDARSAEKHFVEMAKHSTLPDSVTQANYWLARARQALGDKAGAEAALRIAAGHATVYYGQLARDSLGLPPVALRSMPSTADSEALFEARDVVRAVRLLADNDQKDAAVTLLRGFAAKLDDGGEAALAARLAQKLDAHNLAIQIAEAAERRGTPLDLFSFPKDGLPAAQLAEIDTAAVYAVTRQESRFQVDAVSSAGARGLMQLMPGTARETAEKVGLEYSPSRLTSDAGYNALLGSTYLANQLRRFDGSLLLAAAAYNAGAGNVDRWISAYGDPRADTVDAVVWVELIPFQETRKYVQRVLGNYLVYRARLGQETMTTAEALRRIPG